MNVIIPKSWRDLNKQSKDNIVDYCKQVAEQAALERMIFRENMRYVKKGVQNEMLQKEIESIFRKGGWPHHMFEDIIGRLNPEYEMQNKSVL